MDIQSILSELPHTNGDQSQDWFNSESYYPFHRDLIARLKPKSYVEIGARLGYSIIAALEGAKTIKTIYWADDQSYIDESNRLAHENLRDYAVKNELELDWDWYDSQYSMLTGLLELNLHPDVIYIDGDHTFEGALSNLLTCHVLRPKKAIIVDDLVQPDVRRACQIFGLAVGMPLYILPESWNQLGVFDYAGGRYAQKMQEDKFGGITA